MIFKTCALISHTIGIMFAVIVKTKSCARTNQGC